MIRGYYRDFIGHRIPLDLSRVVVGGISISCVDSVENLGVAIDSLKIYLETPDSSEAVAKRVNRALYSFSPLHIF